MACQSRPATVVFRQSCPRIPRYSSFPSSPLLQLYGIKNRNCIQSERSYEDKQIIKTDHRSQSRTTIQLSYKYQWKKLLKLFLIYCYEILQVIAQNIPGLQLKIIRPWNTNCLPTLVVKNLLTTKNPIVIYWKQWPFLRPRKGFI